MNSKRPENRQFVIEDLDATHLLIKTDEEDSMREELEAEARPLLSFLSNHASNVCNSSNGIHTASTRSPTSTPASPSTVGIPVSRRRLHLGHRAQRAFLPLVLHCILNDNPDI